MTSHDEAETRLKAAVAANHHLVAEASGAVADRWHIWYAIGSGKLSWHAQHLVPGGTTLSAWWLWELLDQIAGADEDDAERLAEVCRRIARQV
jgi:hypothetical protein